MRSYPRNSPEAAARIVALVLIADGHVCQSEYEALKKLNAARDLELKSQEMPGIVQTLCEDLLMEGFTGRSILSHIGDGVMASLLAEVDEPGLQSKVLRVIGAVVHADHHISEGEDAMLEAIRRHWKKSPVTAHEKTAAVLP